MRIHSRSIWMRIPWLAGIAVVLGPEQVASTDTNLYFDWSPGYFKWGFEFLVETTAGPPDAAAPGQPATVTSSIVNYNGVVANNSEVMFYWECRDIVEGGELTSAILVDFTSGNQTIARGDWAGSGEQQLEGDVPYFPMNTEPRVEGAVFSLSLNTSVVQKLADENQNKILFFQLGWNDTNSSDKYGTSPPWAFARDEPTASSLYSNMSSSSAITLIATPSVSAMYDQASTAYVDPSATTSSPAGASGTLSPSETAATSASHGGSSHDRLSTGAIAGIAIGGFAVLVLAGLALGWCACVRRRRRHARGGGRMDADAGADAGADGVGGRRGRNVQTIQDLMMADKERRAGLTGDDHPLGTPYSEEPEEEVHGGGGGGGSGVGIGQRDLHRPLGGVSGRGSGIEMDMDLGQSRGGGGGGGMAAGENARSGGGSGDSPTTRAQMPTHPSASPEHVHERTSMMATGSPTTQRPSSSSSSQQRHHDYAFSPYRDRGRGHDGDGDDDDDENDIQDSPITPAAEEDGEGEGLDPPPPLPRSLVRSATPGAISEQYAHLVEEGMTEDELRRLEEEERALDEAIEQQQQRVRADSRARGLDE